MTIPIKCLPFKHLKQVLSDLKMSQLEVDILHWIMVQIKDGANSREEILASYGDPEDLPVSLHDEYKVVKSIIDDIAT
jgi:hypothetical protein